MSDFPKLPRIKQDDENMEKLHSAARRGQTEVLRRLIANGVDPNIANKFGCTAFHLACKHGQLGAIRELGHRVESYSIPWHGRRPLQLAVESGNVEAVTTFIETLKNANRDVIAVMNECGDEEIFEIGEHQKHCLGQTVTHWCIGVNNMTMLKLLITHGASPTSKDRSAETPIMRAIEFNNEEAFNILTSVPNIRLDNSDRQGRTHLHWAFVHNRQRMAERLLDLGEEVNAEDVDKNTILSTAVQSGSLKHVETILSKLEPFALQTAPFHNGKDVIAERIDWFPFVEEAVRGEMVKLLQKRLDNLLREKAAQQANLNSTVTSKGGSKAPPTQNMTLAPSAPIKKS